ncbi:MAG: response regulator [Campylobacterales bacterium]|nr:response regulator [Campylobacterales bacterium]
MVSLKDLKELSCEQNILYVEDEEMLRGSMEGMLSKLFKNVFVADNGAKALEIYKRENIDIVLTDINMPIMDGVELIQHINKLSDDAVIIVLSAHDESHLLYKLINLEVNSFLNKLSQKDELIKMLYKNCSIVFDRKLLKLYAKKLEEENLIIARKNQILEKKLNQLAYLQNSSKETQNVVEPKSEVLNQDDKDELSDITSELERVILSFYSEINFDKENLFELGDLFMKYSLILSYYKIFYDVSIVLEEFSKDIVTYGDNILKDIKNAAINFEALLTSLEIFRQNVWIKGDVEQTFYNISLVDDIKQISKSLK